MFGKVFSCQSRNARSRNVLLHAAAAAARARLRLRGVDRHVAELTRRAVCACHHASIRNDRAADTRAERDEYHVLAATAAAFPGFTHRRSIRVVHDHNRQPYGLFQRRAHIKYAPAEVHAAVHHTVRRHRPGDARAHAQNAVCGNVVLFSALLNFRRNITQHRRAVALNHGRNLPLFKQSAVFLK